MKILILSLYLEKIMAIIITLQYAEDSILKMEKFDS